MFAVREGAVRGIAAADPVLADQGDLAKESGAADRLVAFQANLQFFDRDDAVLVHQRRRFSSTPPSTDCEVLRTKAWFACCHTGPRSYSKAACAASRANTGPQPSKVVWELTGAELPAATCPGIAASP